MTDPREIQRIRDLVPLPRTISELYADTGHLKSEYIAHTRAERAIQRYHKRAGESVTQPDDLPLGIQQALKLPLVWVQIVNRYPWKVMWVRVDSNGRKRRGELLCPGLGAAVIEWRRILELVPNATIVSRARGYDIHPDLRGQLPPRWYWCPYCMKPRKFLRDPQGRKFHVMKKTWDQSSGRFKYAARQVYMLVCPMCGCNNRSPVFRRSNQPWEVRKFKRGVRRARPLYPGNNNHRRRRAD